MSGRPIPPRDKRTRVDWARINAINAEGRKRRAAGQTYFKKQRVNDKKQRTAEPIAGSSGVAAVAAIGSESDSDQGGDPNFPDFPQIRWPDEGEVITESPVANRTRSKTLPQSQIDEAVSDFINALAAGDEPGPRELSPLVEEHSIFSTETDADGDTIMSSALQPEEPSAALTAGNIGSNSSGSSTNAGGDNEQLLLFKAVSMIEQGDIVFTHKFHFQTWGNAWKRFDGKANINSTTNGIKRTVTSACQLYTNHVTQFMSPAEFESLPAFATVKKVALRVTPLAIESSFETAGTLSASASIQHAPMFIYNHGGNLAYPLETVNLVFQKGSMDVTEIKAFKDTDWTKLLWGDADQTGFPAVTGLNRNWPVYDCWVTPLKSAADNPWSQATGFGCPQFDKIYTSALAADIINSRHTITWSYSPQLGLLKTPVRAHAYFPSDGLYLNGSHGYALNRLKQNAANSATLAYDTHTLGPMSLDRANVILGRDIEKAFGIAKLNTNHSAPQVPSCSFGILPVPNNAPTADNSFVNCKLLFVLETYIKIKVDYESYNTFIQTMASNGEVWHDGTYFDNYNPVTFDSNTTFSTSLSPSATAAKLRSVQSLSTDVEMINPENVTPIQHPVVTKPEVPVILSKPITTISQGSTPTTKVTDTASSQRPSLETLCKQPSNANHPTCKNLKKAKKKNRKGRDVELVEEDSDYDDVDEER